VEREIMATSPDGSPTHVHRALDHLTAATIELQQLRRRLGNGHEMSAPEIDKTLSSLEDRLREMREILTTLRDQAQHVS
jgi:regulator of replication initiation timing